MSGHIVLADTKSGFIPAAIKWFTGSKFSHSFVRMPSVLGIPMAIEAAELGVDFTRFDVGYENNKNESYQVWNIKIDQGIKDKALISILNDLELVYGYFQYIWFIWRRICLFFGKDIKSEDNKINQGMICSQLCVAYLNACELQHTMYGYGIDNITPQDLYDIFIANPDIFELVETVRM